MSEMADDRIYADRRGKTDVYVGADLGLTLVAISDDRVGRFRLLRRGRVESVATGGDAIVIGTETDVFRATTENPEAFDSLGFGSTVAVASDGPIAASPDGDVARYDGGQWKTLGTVEKPRAIAGNWIAAEDGLYRIEDETITPSGPSANDVTGGPEPIAATDQGLIRFADDDWNEVRRGAFRAVAIDGERVLALGDEGLFERRGGEWTGREVPTDEPLVDVGYGQGIVAITAAGTVLVDPLAAKDGAEGWRSRSLGLGGVSELAVGPVR